MEQYKGKMPSDAREYGFSIERKHVEHDLPVREVFPDGNKEYEELVLLTQEAIMRKGLDSKEQSDIVLAQFPKLLTPEVDKRAMVGRLAEAYEFTSWGEDVRLYNFSAKKVTDEQMGEISNALRGVGQTTGGALQEHLSRIVILPDGHPILLVKNDDQKYVQCAGVAYKGLVALSERALSLPKQNEGDGMVPRREAKARPHHIGSSLEDVLAHEFYHILGYANPDAEGEVMSAATELSPSLYGDTHFKEALADTGSAGFIGGEVTEHVGVKHRQAHEKFVNKVHTNRQGPTFVTCQELDPRKL